MDVADGAEVESAITHVREDEEFLNLGEVMQPLVQFYIGHHAAGEHEVALARLAQPVLGNLDGVHLEQVLAPRGDVLAAVALGEVLAPVVDAALAEPAGESEITILPDERRGLINAVRVAVCGEASNFALVPAGDE